MLLSVTIADAQRSTCAVSPDASKNTGKCRWSPPDATMPIGTKNAICHNDGEGTACEKNNDRDIVTTIGSGSN